MSLADEKKKEEKKIIEMPDVELEFKNVPAKKGKKSIKVKARFKKKKKNAPAKYRMKIPLEQSFKKNQNYESYIDVNIEANVIENEIVTKDTIKKKREKINIYSRVK